MSRGSVALSGYYGFDNAGDEAVLSGLVQSLLKVSDGAATITALSIDPASTTALHGVKSAHRYRAGDLLQTIASCRLFASGGGSLLQDVTSAHSIFYYLAVVRMAQLLGKKTMFAAQGIGPLLLPRSQKLVASVANRLDAITVRDPDSQLLLRSIGVKKPIEVTADPAILLGSAAPKHTPSEIIGAALRPWRDPSFSAAAAQALAVTDIAAQLLPISMHPKTDDEVMEQFKVVWHQRNKPVLQGRPSGEGLDLNQLLGDISQCDLMVGMRLHAIILAASFGIPSVAIAYDPKVTSFMDITGQGDAVCSPEASNTDDLGKIVQKVWSERKSRSDALNALLPSLKIAASRTAEVAWDLAR